MALSEEDTHLASPGTSSQAMLGGSLCPSCRRERTSVTPELLLSQCWTLCSGGAGQCWLDCQRLHNLFGLWVSALSATTPEVPAAAALGQSSSHCLQASPCGLFAHMPLVTGFPLQVMFSDFL